MPGTARDSELWRAAEWRGPGGRETPGDVTGRTQRQHSQSVLQCTHNTTLTHIIATHHSQLTSDSFSITHHSYRTEETLRLVDFMLVEEKEKVVVKFLPVGAVSTQETAV